MAYYKKKIVSSLIETGMNLLNQPRKTVDFTEHQEANRMLNNLEEYPHIFVMACIMDRQIKAERAWIIPYIVMEETGGFNFEDILKTEKEKITEIFKQKSLHRFNEEMSSNFYHAVRKIEDDYGGIASGIWKNRPGSATVVKRFLEFRGVGIKISTMAANILVRDFKIPLKDYICIDISPDVQVQRVFKRLGFIPDGAKSELLIYAARELNPEYPGIFDLSCWEIGRKWCRPTNPYCINCMLGSICPKLI